MILEHHFVLQIEVGHFLEIFVHFHTSVLGHLHNAVVESVQVLLKQSLVPQQVNAILDFGALMFLSLAYKNRMREVLVILHPVTLVQAQLCAIQPVFVYHCFLLPMVDSVILMLNMSANMV
jgi:hypothetical protein